MEFIDLKAQQKQAISNEINLKDQINSNIRKVLDHGKYILGPEVKEIEVLLAEYVGVKHCIAVSSGTDALFIAMLALDIKKGDEIITTPFSFMATAETISLLGAIPVFVDIDKETYNLDSSLIEAAITNKTKAIIPVSLYGQPANFQEINKIAKKYGLPVIEDGAQSFGSTHHGFKSCSLSTIGTTSFFPSKPFGGYGDSGACFTDDDELALKMREISKHGQSKRYFHTKLGINGRMDTIQAAILIAKFPLFPLEVIEREKIANKYNYKLLNGGFKDIPKVINENTSVYAQYTILVEDRNRIQNILKENGIPTSVHYPRLLSHQPALSKKFRSRDTKIALEKSKKVLSLPMHPWLSDSDQDKIVTNLLKALDL